MTTREHEDLLATLTDRAGNSAPVSATVTVQKNP